MDEAERHDGGSRGRRGIAALAALLALIPIIVGIIITSGNGKTSTGPGVTLTQAKANQPPIAHRPGPNLPPGTGALVALVKRSTTMRITPGGRSIAQVGTRTNFGSPQVMLVTKLRGSWLGVISPIIGNNRTGWIPRSATDLGRVPWELKVSLRERRLTVLYAGKTLQRYTVAVGRPDAPTPTGHFAVTDRLSTGNPSGPYGCCILALSAKSPHAIQGWTGGNRIAIHSTPDTSSIGLPVSHGCVRLTLAEGRWLLGHIPLGTPTVIST